MYSRKTGSSKSSKTASVRPRHLLAFRGIPTRALYSVLRRNGLSAWQHREGPGAHGHKPMGIPKQFTQLLLTWALSGNGTDIDEKGVQRLVRLWHLP